MKSVSHLVWAGQALDPEDTHSQQQEEETGHGQLVGQVSEYDGLGANNI